MVNIKKDDYEQYEKEIDSIGEFIGTELNINPAYYIHNAILKAQQALSDENINNGVYKFMFYVENIEIITKANDNLPDDYDEQIAKFTKQEDYKKAERITQYFKLANYKLQLLLSGVFSQKLTTTPMKA